MSLAVSVNDLGKCYKVPRGGNRGGAQYRTFRDVLIDLARSPFGAKRQDSSESFWALRGLSFQVRPGCVLGLVGHNGAGKSTLLKILARITRPTEGTAELHGRVGSLLEVGTGFHPELTGRENIFLNGSILGMTRKEVRAKFADIVDFAGVGEFLNLPVKRYSSGMYVRLAFAVAAHLDTEILLIDEVLAVGDAEFQRRCLERIRELCNGGRTIIFVSHNLTAVQNLCDDALLIERGQATMRGGPEQVVQQYMQRIATSVGGEVDLREHQSRYKGSTPMIQSLRIRDGDGEITDQVPCGSPLTIEMEIDPPADTGGLQFFAQFDDQLGQRLFSVSSEFDPNMPLVNGMARVECIIDDLALAPGRYILSLGAWGGGRYPYDSLVHCFAFDVIESDYFGNGRMPPASYGAVLKRSRWQSHLGSP